MTLAGRRAGGIAEIQNNARRVVVVEVRDSVGVKSKCFDGSGIMFLENEKKLNIKHCVLSVL